MTTSFSQDPMSEDDWAFHERLTLSVRAPNGRTPLKRRLVLDGIFWIARTGSPWRDRPDVFGKWSSVYRPCRRVTLAVQWEDILDAHNGNGLVPVDALLMVDIAVVRTQRQAAGADGGLRGGLFAIQGVSSRPISASAPMLLDIP